MTTTVRVPREVYWHQKEQMFDWCQYNFGEWDRYWPDPKTWSSYSTFGAADFYFKNEADATAFTLRWL